MKFLIKNLSLFLVLISMTSAAHAEIKPNNDIARQWNQFVQDLLSLSNKITENTPHYKKHRIGGYSGEPEFYTETKFFNKKDDSLISTIQWEKANSSAIHSIEVNVRDQQGRLLKDFSASYLTKHRNAPIQTLITLHYYNKDLHAFRVFDASHNRIYEVCRGSLNGKKVNIDLDDDYGELAEALEDKKGIMSSDTYLACFGGRSVDKSRLNVSLN